MMMMQETRDEEKAGGKNIFERDCLNVIFIESGRNEEEQKLREVLNIWCRIEKRFEEFFN